MTRSRDVANTQTNSGGAVSPFLAGKNKIINGDFGIWQRGTSFSSVADNSYTADRFKINFNGTGVRTVSRESFTTGTAPVAGYEGSYFARINQTTAGTGGSYQTFQQPIEDVRTFAGQTVTLSFWAKADSNRTITAQINQYFGTGGSPSATVTNDSGNLSLTTSWQRFSYTVTLASLSGKTIGTNNNSFLQVQYVLPFNTTFTIDFWGVQVEAGSVATPFTTASGSLGGELALCQRYYYVASKGANGTTLPAVGYTNTSVYIPVPFGVTMRGTPTMSATTGTNYYVFLRNGASDEFNSVTLDFANVNGALIYNNSEISGTAGHAGWAYAVNASASIAFSAEL